MSTIICVGNRHDNRDSAGPAVHDRLAAGLCPHGVTLIDGGLGGLDLIRHVDGASRAVFVDSVSGFGAPGEVVLLRASEVAAQCSGSYDHAAGLPYLLNVIPLACDDAPSQVAIVGIERDPTAAAIETASLLAVQLATSQEFFDD